MAHGTLLVPGREAPRPAKPLCLACGAYHWVQSLQSNQNKGLLSPDIDSIGPWMLHGMITMLLDCLRRGDPRNTCHTGHLQVTSTAIRATAAMQTAPDPWGM